MRTKFQLYTVPGQVYYNSTRKLVLQGVDGIVFVADSQESMLQENVESFENLRQNLKEYGKDLKDISVVLQYNKRDLPNAMPPAALDEVLNPDGEYTTFEAVATTGEGVFPTLKALAGHVLESLNRDRRRAGGTGPTAAPAAPAAAPAAPVAPAAAPAVPPSPAPVRRAPAAASQEPRTAAAIAEPATEPGTRHEPAPQSRPAAQVRRRSRPAPKIQKVVLEEDRGSLLMMGLLLLIILAAAGVILVSFNVV
jgi:hypothetical protein